MSKGKRYNGTGNKLNVKKVFAVVIAILAIIMFILILTKIEIPKIINIVIYNQDKRLWM